MKKIETVGVFCASSTKVRPSFFAAARRVGELLASNGMTMYFGAGNMGLMGAAAEGVVSAGGKLVGVIPAFMVEQNWHFSGCSELIVSEGMSDRKQTIERASDALLVLPGGIGTMDELFEVLVDKQLGLHGKPIVILNTDGYYDTLLRFVDEMISEEMLRPVKGTMFQVVATPEEAIEAMQSAPDWDGAKARKHAKI